MEKTSTILLSSILGCEYSDIQYLESILEYYDEFRDDNFYFFDKEKELSEIIKRTKQSDCLNFDNMMKELALDIIQFLNGYYGVNEEDFEIIIDGSEFLNYNGNNTEVYEFLNGLNELA